MAREQMKSGTTSDRVGAASPALIEDIRQIIGEARRSVATTVNAGLTACFTGGLANGSSMKFSAKNGPLMVNRLSYRWRDNWFRSMVRASARRIYAG